MNNNKVDFKTGGDCPIKGVKCIAYAYGKCCAAPDSPIKIACNKLTTKNKNMKKLIKDFCNSNNITEKQFYGKENVGGYLNLSSLTSIPEGFNPTVGGSLDLSSLTSIPEGFNPTVGGYLDLSSLTSIPEGFNPTVGGSLDLSSGLKGKWNVLPQNYKYSWNHEKYIMVDGIFTEVVKKKGNVYHVKKVSKDKVFYLITDGEKWSHGYTLKEAKEDLIFKINNRTKDDYKNLKLNTSLYFNDAIMCYRVITGACSFGTKDYINNRLPKKQKSFTISEIIKLTKGEYGNETFANFFSK